MVKTFTARAQVRSLVEELRFHMAQPNKKKSIILEFGGMGRKGKSERTDNVHLSHCQTPDFESHLS